MSREGKGEGGTYLKKMESKVDPREKVRRVSDPRGTGRALARRARERLEESTYK